jgi:NitT/TauT family transport system substrate-binding protein
MYRATSVTRRHRTLLPPIVGAVTLALVAACSSSAPTTQPATQTSAPATQTSAPAEPTNTPADTTSEPPAEPTPVTIVLGFLASPEFAAGFAADEQGFFAEEGIDVTIQQGGPTVNGEQLVAEGQADFMYGGMADIAGAIESGLDLIAVAGNSSQLLGIALPGDSAISTPADLAGTTISVATGAVPQILLEPFLTANSVDPATVTQQPIPGTGGIAAILAGQIQGATGGVGTIVGLQQEDPDATMMLYSDYGIDVIGVGLITTNELVDNNPDLVGRVVRALVKGIEFSVENPEEATAAVAAQFPDAVSAYVDPPASAVLELANSVIAKPYGFMPPEVWAANIDLLVQTGSLSAPMEPTDLYTNEFVPQ